MMDTKRLTQVLGAVGIAAGLGLGAAGLAAAATGSSSTPAAHPSANVASTDTSSTAQNQQDPNYQGSVQVAETNRTNEATEAASLQASAKITPDQAKQAALAAVPGTASKVDLDNENGSAVYSVEITANGTTTDVKVDAGNGKVLSRDAGQDQGKSDTADRSGETPGTEHGAPAETNG